MCAIIVLTYSVQYFSFANIFVFIAIEVNSVRLQYGEICPAVKKPDVTGRNSEAGIIYTIKYQE